MNTKTLKEELKKVAGICSQEVASWHNSLNQLVTERIKAEEIIRSVVAFSESALTPDDKNFTSFKNTKNNLMNYEEQSKTIFVELEKIVEKGGGGITAAAITTAAIGFAAAVGGPSAAMAIALTFGISSTGVAISTLSGAAATIAALAWLGGGSIAIGGGGIAGGMAALLGILAGGVVLFTLGAGGLIVFLSIKNRNESSLYSESIEFMNGTINEVKKSASIASNLYMETMRLETKIQMLFSSLSILENKFSLWNEHQQDMMCELGNLAEDLSNKILAVVPLDIEKCNEGEFYKKGLEKLSLMDKYPEPPHTFGIGGNDKKPGKEWVTIAVGNGFKLQLTKILLHYRILTPENKRLAYGDKKEINRYFDTII